MANYSETFHTLIVGVANIKFSNNEQSNNYEYLKEILYPALSHEEFNLVREKCEAILKALISADMSLNQLDAYLLAQTKRRNAPLIEEQANSVRKFWKENQTDIHRHITDKTVWENTIQKISWRVDMKTHSQNKNKVNCPSLIIEMAINNSLHEKNVADVVCFEMDSEKLNQVLSCLHEIDSHIKKYVDS